MGVYKRPDSPFWWYALEGTSERGSTGIPHLGARTNKHEAMLVYAAKKLRAGVKEVRKPAISYAAFAEWFEAHDIAHHRSAAKEVSILAQLAPYFRRYDSLTAIDVDVVKEWMTWRKGQVLPGTVNRELDVLKLLMAAAVPKYLDASPIAGLRRFRVEEHEPRILTPDEEQRLLAVAAPADQAWLLLALDTLLRLSNVIQLKWAQVKLDLRVIVPLNAKVSHDVVPISRRLGTALEQLPRADEHVFAQFRQRGGQSAKQQAIRRFDYLCQLAIIPHGRAANGVTFHCLRHTGATRALQRGASVRTVMKLGGWKDERSVMRYVHAADSDVRDAAESIGGA